MKEIVTFKRGDKVKVKYMFLTKENVLKSRKIPQFMKWLLTTCNFENQIGVVEKIKEDGKLYVTFNTPVFQDHPNKMDKYGFSAYMIPFVLCNITKSAVYK